MRLLSIVFTRWWWTSSPIHSFSLIYTNRSIWYYSYTIWREKHRKARSFQTMHFFSMYIQRRLCLWGRSLLRARASPNPHFQYTMMQTAFCSSSWGAWWGGTDPDCLQCISTSSPGLRSSSLNIRITLFWRALEPPLHRGAEAGTSLAREQHPTSTKCYPQGLINVMQRSSQSIKGLV